MYLVETFAQKSLEFIAITTGLLKFYKTDSLDINKIFMLNIKMGI